MRPHFDFTSTSSLDIDRHPFVFTATSSLDIDRRPFDFTSTSPSSERLCRKVRVSVHTSNDSVARPWRFSLWLPCRLEAPSCCNCHVPDVLLNLEKPGRCFCTLRPGAIVAAQWQPRKTTQGSRNLQCDDNATCLYWPACMGLRAIACPAAAIWARHLFRKLCSSGLLERDVLSLTGAAAVMIPGADDLGNHDGVHQRLRRPFATTSASRHAASHPIRHICI